MDRNKIETLGGHKSFQQLVGMAEGLSLFRPGIPWHKGIAVALFSLASPGNAELLADGMQNCNRILYRNHICCTLTF